MDKDRFSELRSNGPRLPAGSICLPAAVERIGRCVCPDWDGTEREAAALADEGIAVANHCEPPPEPLPLGEAACAVCQRPATRVRDGRSYCARHGKQRRVPKRARDWLRESRSAAFLARASRLIDDEEPRPLPDQAALMRWAKAYMALRDKVLDGTLPAALRAPGGKIVYLSRDEWRAQGFPAPDEAKARLPSRGGIPMHVILVLTELDQAFRSPADIKPSEALSQCGPDQLAPTHRGRRSQSPERDRVQAAMLADLDAGGETPESLGAMKGEYLAARYRGKRTTCVEARSRVLSEIAGRQRATTDK